MSLQILVAGVGKDERARIEAAVKSAFGGRVTFEPWTVSLVRIGRQWSVTLSGPEERFRNLSFVATEDRLGDSILEALEGKTAAQAASATHGFISPSVGTIRSDTLNRHSCEACRNQFVVIFESQPGEAKVLAAVACPYCWHINRVEIGAWAASGHDYRAEKT